MRPFILEPNYGSDSAEKLKSQISSSLFNDHDIERTVNRLRSITSWDTKSISITINEIAQELNFPHSQIMKLLRYILTGQLVGIEMEQTMCLLGKEKCIDRILAY
jgi:glutamyl/glutaminyl-tRNA synthetase